MRPPSGHIHVFPALSEILPPHRYEEIWAGNGGHPILCRWLLLKFPGTDPTQSPGIHAPISTIPCLLRPPMFNDLKNPWVGGGGIWVALDGRVAVFLPSYFYASRHWTQLLDFLNLLHWMERYLRRRCSVESFCVVHPLNERTFTHASFHSPIHPLVCSFIRMWNAVIFRSFFKNRTMCVIGNILFQNFEPKN